MARRGLLLSVILGALCAGGCSFSVKPSYSKHDLETVVKDKVKREAGVDVVTKLVGSTFWVYLPLENVFETPEKPPLQYKRFSVTGVTVGSSHETVKVQYGIKSVPQKLEPQTTVFSKNAIRKISSVWLVLRRITFSMDDQSQQDVKFYCVVTADISGGFDVFQLVYYRDLVKMSFSMMQVPEFQHRIITEPMLAPQARGDKEGRHIKMKDFTFKEFIVLQIKNRVANRFQGENNKLKDSPLAGMTDKDIDREVSRIAAETLRIYGYKDFTSLETNNLLTREKALFDKLDIEKRFRR